MIGKLSNFHTVTVLCDFFFKLISVKKTSIIVAGGADNKLPEILTSNSSTKIKLQIPTLPEIQSEIQSCSMFKQDGNIMACITDPNNTWCLELYKGDWKIHSILKNQRDGQNSVVDTEFATFIFGGSDENHRTYEYLPKGSKTWKIGKKQNSCWICQWICHRSQV